MKTTKPNQPDLRRDLKRLVKWASVLGFLLGLVCGQLPQEYQAACHAIVSACTSGG